MVMQNRLRTCNIQLKICQWCSKKTQQCLDLFSVQVEWAWKYLCTTVLSFFCLCPRTCNNCTDAKPSIATSQPDPQNKANPNSKCLSRYKSKYMTANIYLHSFQVNVSLNVLRNYIVLSWLFLPQRCCHLCPSTCFCVCAVNQIGNCGKQLPTIECLNSYFSARLVPQSGYCGSQLLVQTHVGEVCACVCARVWRASDGAEKRQAA